MPSTADNQSQRKANNELPSQQRVQNQPGVSYITLRQNQVIEMTAGKKFEARSSAPEWPTPSQEMQKRWIERHPTYNTFSSRYMMSQKRLLFLGDLPPSDRFETFERICFERQLAPTTAESYWTTWLGVQKALAITPCDADARTTKLLKARSTAYPVTFPTPLSMEQMNELRNTYEQEFPSLVAVATLAFICGQRISDMIQLAVSDLEPQPQHLMINVRRGKTMATKHPYVLWLRRNVYPTEELIKIADQAKSSNRLFLFSTFNSDDERKTVLEKIRDITTSISEDLELRSFRRGGLQRLAGNGFPLTSLLELSQHSDEEMLMRYLGWGKHAAHRQGAMIEMVDSMTSDLDHHQNQTPTKISKIR